MPPASQRPPPTPPKPQPPPDDDGPRVCKIKIETKRGVREYSIMTLDADTGAKVFGQISGYLAGPIAAFIMVATNVPGSSHAMTAALQDMTRQFSDDSFRELLWTLTHMPMVDGREIKEPKHHFAGNYGVWARLVLHALRENFGSFSDGVPPEQRERLTYHIARLSRHVEKMASSLVSSEQGSPPSTSSEPSTISEPPSDSSGSQSTSTP